jgi:hypothetical protein
MNSAVYNPTEEEVLHFGRIYNHPVYLIISEYIYEMSVADDDED